MRREQLLLEIEKAHAKAVGTHVEVGSCSAHSVKKISSRNSAVWFLCFIRSIFNFPHFCYSVSSVPAFLIFSCEIRGRGLR